MSVKANFAQSKALRRMGWGLLFELIDIRIAAFDLLPDFIGYILLATALSALGGQHAGFRRARWAAIAMIALTLPSVLVTSNAGFADMAVLPLGLHLYGQALLAVHVAMAYWMFGGLRHMAAQAGDSGLQAAAELRMQLYMAVNFAQLAAYPFVLNAGDDMIGLLLVAGVLAFIMELLLLGLTFKTAKRRLPAENEN